MQNQIDINPEATLYVGDLHHDVDEQILLQIFQSYGTILSIRVCRDIFTFKSLGYAYVNFQHQQHAELAKQNINHQIIHGYPCRIMWSNRDPSSRKSNQSNIFIKNLHKSITATEIYDTFQYFGEIISCKLQTDHNGYSKGFAFINYKHQCDALKAIETINGKSIRNKIVYVGKFVPQCERLGRMETFTNCLIKNIPNHFTDTNLRDLFQPFGEVVDAKICVDENGVSECFGVVKFNNHQDAMKAIDNLNGIKIDDEIVYVGRGLNCNKTQQNQTTQNQTNQKHNSNTTIYVKHLHENIDDDRLKEIFSIFGEIISAKVVKNKSNKTSRRFGFVQFSTSDEVSQAMNEMDGKIVYGNKLYVRLVESREERNEKLCFLFDKKMYEMRIMKANEE